LGINRKRICDFLLVRHSNFGPNVHHFGDIAGFLLLPPGPFHPTFWVFPLDQIADVGVSPSTYLKLITVKLFSKYIPTYVNVTDGRADRQTTYCGIIALCLASLGKNN